MDTISVPVGAAGTDSARVWTSRLLRYREPNHLRSAIELGISFGPLAVLWMLMWLAYSFGFWWLTLLLAVPAAGFLVRLFLIQHDCGHGAFFRHRAVNDWTGRVLGVFTMTPYDLWRRTHAVHHATTGNLDRRGMGDVDTLTVREYLALPRGRRLLYRLYRNPLVMFGLGPAYLFFLQHRLPVGMMRSGWTPWLSTMATNAALALIAGVLVWLIGLVAFALVHLLTVLLAATFGVWLFYVQHQFDQALWTDGADWDLHEAALHGSSYYVLPGVLRWFTANIGMHHVHHLCSRIPYYRLPRVLKENPELGSIGRLTLWDSLKCVRLALWDESRQKLISFGELRRMGVAAQPACRLRSRHAAIEIDALAGDEAGGVGREKQRGAHQIVRRFGARNALHGDDTLFLLGRDGLALDLGEGRAGQNGVDGGAVRCGWDR